LGEVEGRSARPAWLSSHPFPEERIERIQATIAALDPPLPANLRVGANDFMTRLDGLVYGVNPRNGFFRASLYLHPELQFQITFPSGWQFRNLAQAVLAGSPQNDAMMELTLSPVANLDQAAQRFFQQQGIRQGQTSRTTVGGNAAIAGYFEAQTQQGPVRGLATFISYGGRVYQILGYSVAGRFGAYDPVFRQSTGSFQRLTDPQALNVQPNRVRIVTIQQAMTLAQFNERFPSAIDIGELAILNQVEGPGTMLPAGRSVKRVAQ
jgi:predicted Zn-dependent protease